MQRLKQLKYMVRLYTSNIHTLEVIFSANIINTKIINTCNSILKNQQKVMQDKNKEVSSSPLKVVEHKTEIQQHALLVIRIGELQATVIYFGIVSTHVYH